MTWRVLGLGGLMLGLGALHGCVAPSPPHGWTAQRLCSSCSVQNQSLIRARLQHQTPSQQPSELRVIVVTLDGVRWQDVFGGLDPVLAAQRGMKPEEAEPHAPLMPQLIKYAHDKGFVLGDTEATAFYASGPNYISMPGYTELFSGRTPKDCQNNQCQRPRGPTLLDELRTNQSWPTSDLAVIASWPPIALTASWQSQSAVVSAGRWVTEHSEFLRTDEKLASLQAKGAATLCGVGEAPFRCDRFTAALALRYWQVYHPRFMFVGLGETDEYGHEGDYRSYVEAMRLADGFLGELLDDIFQGKETKTLVLVTTDHGRARNFTGHGWISPESGRTFLIGVGASLVSLGLPCKHRLADLAPSLRMLFDLPPDLHPDAGCPLGIVQGPSGAQASL